MKVGDFIEFSGEYYFLLEDGRWEWVLTKCTQTGLITLDSAIGLQVTSADRQYIIRHSSLKDKTCKVRVLSELPTKS